MSDDRRHQPVNAALLQILEEQIQAGQTSASFATKALVPDVDLRTLLSEFTALKMDIRAQTQSVREAQQSLDASQRAHHEAMAERDSQAEAALKRMQSQQAQARQTSLEATIDLIDRLDATIQGGRLSRPSGFRRWLAASSATTIDALIEGMLMIRERALSTLEAQGVTRIETLHQPFDPIHMAAVETSSNPTLADGIVTTEILAGYLDNMRPLRVARVIVNRRRREDPP